MSDEIFTLEETLSRLTGFEPANVHWDMIEDPDGTLRAIFFKKGDKRCCVFCKNALLGPDFPALEVETKDRGMVNIFFCSRSCQGAPTISIHSEAETERLKKG